MADRHMVSLPDPPNEAVLGPVPPEPDLCILQRNEPGWLVGAHRHTRFRGAAATEEDFSDGRVEKEIELPEEGDRNDGVLEEV